MNVFLSKAPALNTISAIKAAQSSINSSLETLATGKKPLSGADGTNAFSQISAMSAQLFSLEAASQNVTNGMSLLEKADGSLDEISDMLARLKELALQGSSSAISATERTSLISETGLLLSEIESQSTNTTHNRFSLLDGSFQGRHIQTGANMGETVVFSISSAKPSNLGAHSSTGPTREALTAAETAASNTTTDNEDIILTTAGVAITVDVSAQDSAKTVSTKINAISHETLIYAEAQTFAHLFSTNATAASYTVKINGSTTSAFSISSSDVADAVAKINLISATTGVNAVATTSGKVLLHDKDGDDITIENAGAGGDLDVKAVESDGLSEGANAISLGVGDASNNDSTRVIGTLRIYSQNTFSIAQNGSSSIGYAATGPAALSAVTDLDLSSATSASNSLAILDSAIGQIADSRGHIGGLMSRLEFTDSLLDAKYLASRSAISGIEDADYAMESSRLSRAMILQQLNTALLSQVNASQELVLKLLDDAA